MTKPKLDVVYVVKRKKDPSCPEMKFDVVNITALSSKFIVKKLGSIITQKLKGKFSSGIEGALASTLNHDF